MVGFSGYNRRTNQNLMVPGVAARQVAIRPQSALFKRAHEPSTFRAPDTALVTVSPPGLNIPFAYPGVRTNSNSIFVGHPFVSADTNMNRFFPYQMHTNVVIAGTNMNRFSTYRMPMNVVRAETNMNRFSPYRMHMNRFSPYRMPMNVVRAETNMNRFTPYRMPLKVSAETNMNRFFPYRMPNSYAAQRASAQQEAILYQRNKEYTDMLVLREKLEAEKIQAEQHRLQTVMNDPSYFQSLLNKPCHELSTPESQFLRLRLWECKQLLKKRVWDHVVVNGGEFDYSEFK